MKSQSSEISITFFVPCYNEELNIVNTLNVIQNSVDDIAYEILIADDNSSDSTVRVVEKYIKENPNSTIKLIKNVMNKGLGSNYFTSANVAKGKYFMLVNGDNVEPIEAIRAILKLIGKADLIIPNFGKSDKRTGARKLISTIFTKLVNIISGNRIEYYNGPVLHLTSNVKNSSVNSTGYGYQAELLCELLANKASKLQVTIKNGDREWGASKAFAPKNFISVGGSLIKIFVRRIW